jgi:hypothetical protein
MIMQAVDQIEEILAEQRDRIQAFLQQIGGKNVVWGAAHVLSLVGRAANQDREISPQRLARDVGRSP